MWVARERAQRRWLSRSVAAIGAAVTLAAVLPAGTAGAQSYIQGIDVSHWQKSINWAKVARARYRFAFAKATDGRTFEDPNYAAYRSGATSHGIYFGAYHFARPEGSTWGARRWDARREADFFVQTAKPAAGDLLPVLDLEKSGGLSPRHLKQWVTFWLRRVESDLDVKPIIYSGIYFWKNSMNDTTKFADEGYKILWLPHYTSDSTTEVPADNWGGNGWTFWQYTSSGSVPGIDGRVDLDRYRYTSFDRVLIPERTQAQAPVNIAPPVVSGGGNVGEWVSTTPGTWSGHPTSYTYAWLRCNSVGEDCKGIWRATYRTYRLRRKDYGHTVEVVVTASNSAGSASATSAPTTIIGDDTPPTAPLTAAGTGRFTRSRAFQVTWESSDDASGVAGYDVSYRVASIRSPLGAPRELAQDTTETSRSFTGRPGRTYCFQVVAVDAAGNTSDPGEDCTSIPTDDAWMSHHGEWDRVTSAEGYFEGTYSASTTRHSRLRKRHVRVKRISLVAARCPGCGTVEVRFNGETLKTIDLSAGEIEPPRVYRAAVFGRVRGGNVVVFVKSPRAGVRIDGVATAPF
jgi:GH25 family lysozyme M1 (1,4-beta-N-acetylmuramidase)